MQKTVTNFPPTKFLEITPPCSIDVANSLAMFLLCTASIRPLIVNSREHSMIQAIVGYSRSEPCLDSAHHTKVLSAVAELSGTDM